MAGDSQDWEGGVYTEPTGQPSGLPHIHDLGWVPSLAVGKGDTIFFLHDFMKATFFQHLLLNIFSTAIWGHIHGYHFN